MMPFGDVRMMMRTIGAAFAAALVLLAGCDAGNPADGPLAGTVASDSGLSASGPNVSPPRDGTPGNPGIGDPPDQYKIDPAGAKGWD